MPVSQGLFPPWISDPRSLSLVVNDQPMTLLLPNLKPDTNFKIVDNLGHCFDLEIHLTLLTS